ncbi:MAG: DMT family transporter [Betaproteobacteria bacterium]|nr:DMT family transporter [Betaproteobacteria bacterium]
MDEHLAARARHERRKGRLFMLGAALCFSTGGVLVRFVHEAAPVAIVFWRSVFMFAFISAVLAALHGRGLAARVRSMRSHGLPSASFLAATFFFYVFALSNTTVANASVLMSTGPIFLALAAWAFLGERPPATVWATISAAMAGIALMFSEGMSAGRLSGNLYALGVPLAFTVNYVFLRRAPGKIDPVPVMMLAAFLASIAALPLAAGLGAALSAPPREFALFVALGVFQTGLGCVLMSLAIHRLPAAELGLIGLTEAVLAPLWVWLGVGEAPGANALAGGAIVLGAVALNQAWALRAERRASAAMAGE